MAFFLVFYKPQKISPFWWNAFARLITFKLWKKVNCQNIPANQLFIFDLKEGHEIVLLFAAVLEIKAKRESGTFSTIIGFFNDGQQKSQYLLVYAER